MCGICGYISKRRITKEELSVMNDTLTHRGPNDAGVELYPEQDGYVVGFAQRRLSILDLSPSGHQPMHSQGGRLSVVFNGEIYNYQELKKELTGYPFQSSCDTEVILVAYLKWGKEFVDHIHGMFAIALYDRETSEVMLVRDRIGKKPLYYWKDGENLVFSSELKPILYCPGFPKEVRREILPRFLFQQYIQAPETIFRDVYQLEPGTFLVFHLGTITGKRKYWDIRETYLRRSREPVQDFAEAKEGLKERLQEAVKKRLVADVPVGCFLSGGYDSSLVAALASRQLQSQKLPPLKTFTIGFQDPAFNEARYAKEVAEYLGCDHTELYIDEKEMLNQVEALPYYFDEPFADNSEIATMLVAKLAKSRVDVALSGDAGDEFFCGYNIYPNVAQAQKLNALGAVTNFAGRLPLPQGKHLIDLLPFRVRVVASNRDPETKLQICSPTYLRVAHAFLSGEEETDKKISAAAFLAQDLNERGAVIPCRYPVESTYPQGDWVVSRMLLDMDTYLPGDILTKVDRASMRYSLESRCPLMDTDVMEYSFRIPQKFKYHHGCKKYILKEIAYDYLPKEMLDRPKTGFGVPIDAWLRGPLAGKLREYADSAHLKGQGIFDASYVSSFIDRYLKNGDAGAATGANYSKIVWSFFVFEQWWEKWMS